jgi:hypothetical protein
MERKMQHGNLADEIQTNIIPCKMVEIPPSAFSCSTVKWPLPCLEEVVEVAKSLLC